MFKAPEGACKGNKKGKVSRKSGMDIQDADYEEVE